MPAEYDRDLVVVDVPCSDETAPRIVVTGALDARSTESLQRAVIGLLRCRRPSGIEIDLQGVTSLDFAGIRALLLCQADARQLECEIALRNTPSTAYRVLQVAGLLEQFGLAKPHRRAAVPVAVAAALGLVGCGLSS
jgi:anti-anti-sigma factor